MENLFTIYFINNDGHINMTEIKLRVVNFMIGKYAMTLITHVCVVRLTFYLIIVSLDWAQVQGFYHVIANC